MKFTGLVAGAAVLSVLVSGCVSGASLESETTAAATTGAAWEAWRAGNATQSGALGERLFDNLATTNEGRHVAALSAHVRGDYNAAIVHYEAIGQDYPRRRELRGAIFESYLHADRPTDALRFATETEMSANARVRAQARVDNPITVNIPGVVGLGFENDALTPFMPGVEGRLNGQSAVFRFDTGGTFVAMSPALATRYNVRSAQCAQGFANLQATQVCQGVADIDLGPVRVTNAPVAVVSSLPAEQLGVELGPVLGTNFLQLFLATIDAPNERLLLSPRGNAAANGQHMALVGGTRTEIPFLLWSDHFIIARGGAGSRRDLNFFVDSGLVAVADDGVQAGLLLPHSQASVWAGVSDPSAAGAIVALAPAIWLGEASQIGQRAMVLPDAAWGSFGTFGGIDVHGLISYGFLKHYAWTLDFERQVIVLSSSE